LAGFTFIAEVREHCAMMASRCDLTFATGADPPISSERRFASTAFVLRVAAAGKSATSAFFASGAETI